jgi:ornithine cyclodeaminase/alanine dehydrogenase-like protein (mu-crystallin family)
VNPRQNDSDIVLYKSVGSALQDVVIAQALYERARQQGLGIELPASIIPVSK